MLSSACFVKRCSIIYHTNLKWVPFDTKHRMWHVLTLSNAGSVMMTSASRGVTWSTPWPHKGSNDPLCEQHLPTSEYWRICKKNIICYTSCSTRNIFFCIKVEPRTLSLTRINFNPNMDKFSACVPGTYICAYVSVYACVLPTYACTHIHELCTCICPMLSHAGAVCVCACFHLRWNVCYFIVGK